MDDTADHSNAVTPGFEASLQIAAAYHCGIIMNSDQGVPSPWQYQVIWNPGPVVETSGTTLHQYLYGAIVTSATDDITYGNPAEYNCDYRGTSGDSAKNCRILKMETAFGKTPIKNTCVFHFDDNAAEAYHVYRGWNGKISLNANPIYVGDLSHYYVNQQSPEPHPSFNESWYTKSVPEVKAELLTLLKAKLEPCAQA